MDEGRVTNNVPTTQKIDAVEEQCCGRMMPQRNYVAEEQTKAMEDMWTGN